MSYKVLRPTKNLSVKPVLGLFTASIPLANSAGTGGVQWGLSFTDRYNFGVFNEGGIAATQGVFASLLTGSLAIHFPKTGTVNSQPVGQQSYFDAAATTRDDVGDNQNVVSSFTGDPDDPAQVPLFGCNKVGFAMQIASDTPSDLFVLKLFRANHANNEIFFATSWLVCQWGPVRALTNAGAAGQLQAALPNLVLNEPYTLPAATSLWFELSNLTSAVHTNTLTGDLFLTS